MNFILGLLQPTIDSVIQAATSAAGTFAGDLIIGAGDMIENTGRGLSNKVTTTVDAWGNTIKSYGGVGATLTTPAGQTVSAIKKGTVNAPGAISATAARAGIAAKNSLPSAPTSYTPFGGTSTTKTVPKSLTTPAVKPLPKVSTPAVASVAPVGKRIPTVKSAGHAPIGTKKPIPGAPKPVGAAKPVGTVTPAKKPVPVVPSAAKTKRAAAVQPNIKKTTPIAGK